MVSAPPAPVVVDASAVPEAAAPASVPPPLTRWARWRANRLLRNSGVYIASNLANSAVPFLLLPILTRQLPAEDFGRLAMFQLATTLFDPVVGLSTATAISRRHFDRSGDRHAFGRYVTNCLYILAGTTGLVALVLVLLPGPLERALQVPFAWLWVALGISVARYLVSVVLTLWQVRHQAVRYAVLSFAQTVGIFVVSLALILGAGLGWRGRAMGELVSVGLLGLCAIVLLWRRETSPSGIHRGDVADALTIGSGLVPHAYGALLVAATDRFMLTQMVGLEQTGLYTVGAQLALGIAVIERAFNLAWAPWLFERLSTDTPADRIAVQRVVRAFNIGIGLLAILLGVLAPWILGWLVGPEYAGASRFVIWLALGAAFTGMYKMVVNPLFFFKKTHLLALVTFGVGAVNVPLSYALIRWRGATGAAQATATAMLITLLVTWWLARRVQLQARSAA